jgi:hypothetical protein
MPRWKDQDMKRFVIAAVAAALLGGWAISAHAGYRTCNTTCYGNSCTTTCY